MRDVGIWWIMRCVYVRTRTRITEKLLFPGWVYTKCMCRDKSGKSNITQYTYNELTFPADAVHHPSEWTAPLLLEWANRLGCSALWWGDGFPLDSVHRQKFSSTEKRRVGKVKPDTLIISLLFLSMRANYIYISPVVSSTNTNKSAPIVSCLNRGREMELGFPHIHSCDLRLSTLKRLEMLYFLCAG